MSDGETEIITKSGTKVESSHIFNVSLRGWICLLITGTVCAMSVMTVKVEEPLYTLVGMCVGYYFAQGGKPKSQISTQ